MFLALLRYLFKKPSQIYGSASFMKNREQRQILASNESGLCIDGKRCISKELSYQHLAIIAPTGAGKTSRYIIPNVLNLEGCSMVVTDPSGEIYNLSSGYLQSKGFEVKRLNVTNLTSSLRYNPFYRVTSHTDIMKISDILVASAYPQSAGDQAFWNDGAKSIIQILIKAVKKEPLKYQNLYTIRSYLNLIGIDKQRKTKLDPILIANLNTDDFQEYQAFISQEEKVMHNILSTAKVALHKLSDPDIATLTSEETLYFETLRQKPTVLFIIVPEHEIRYYKFLLTLLYTQLFHFAMEVRKAGQNYYPIYFLLDEFGNMGTIPYFSSLITTLRKRACSVSIVLQDVEQLNHLYGKADASTILNGGCVNRLFYAGLSLQTCEELERILGKQTVFYKERGYSYEADITPNREREIARSLLTADEIRRMSADNALYICGNKKPVLLETVPYFRDKKLKIKVGVNYLL